MTKQWKVKFVVINTEMYHRAERMKSIGVLQKEIELMDHIIEFCKKHKLDYDSFESKKDMLDVEIEVTPACKYRKFKTRLDAEWSQ